MSLIRLGMKLRRSCMKHMRQRMKVTRCRLSLPWMGLSFYAIKVEHLRAPGGFRMGDPTIPDDSKVFGLELRLDKAYEGIDELWPEGIEKLPLRGVWYTKEEFKAEIDSARSPWKKKRAARDVLRQFSIDKPANKLVASKLLEDLRDTMAGQHGSDNENLTTMGFKPKRKRRPLTPAKQTLANKKKLDTRKLRGTMGKRQKAKLKFEGDLTVHVKPDGTSEAIPTPQPTPEQPQ